MESYLGITQKLANGFVIDLAVSYREQLVNPMNQIPVAIGLMFALVIATWLESHVNKLEHKKVIILKHVLQQFFMFLTTILAYLFITVFNGLLISTIGRDLTVLSLYRTILAIFLIIVVVTVIQFASGKFDKELEEEKNK